MTTEKLYSVNHWGSHPADENDDCWCGEDFATLEEAVVAYDEHPADESVRFVELSGPDIVTAVRRVPGRKARQVNDDDWKHEIAMQAGMGLGIDAYNDEMGY